MVKNLVLVQNSYINTYHPDFMGGANSIFSMFEPDKINQNEENENARMKMEALEVKDKEMAIEK